MDGMVIIFVYNLWLLWIDISVVHADNKNKDEQIIFSL